MVYCDSSFLVALNVPDVWTPTARELVADFCEPIPLIPLGEVELVTRIHRALGEKRLNATEHTFVLRHIEEDISDGVFVRRLPNSNDYLSEALRLSKKYAPSLNVRSLDILHVAAARVLRYKTFASFDKRQRDLASASGMRLLPIAIQKPRF
jgi:predicted nucleic acid-binding protein